MDSAAIEKAKEYFGQIVEEQLNRVEALKEAQDWITDRTQAAWAGNGQKEKI